VGRSAGRPGVAAAKRAGVIDVTVVLVEGGYASTALAPVEVFHSAGILWNVLQGRTPEPRFRVGTASVDGESVASVCPVGLVPGLSLAQVKDTDVVVLAATGWESEKYLARNPAIVPWLKHMYARGAYVAGVCTGVEFLAAAGLLDGRQATTHWGAAESMRARYPRVDWRPEQFITEDGRMLCSGGVYAAIDLSLYMVQKLCGHEVALQTAKSLLLSMPRDRQAGYSMLSLSRPHGDERVRAAEEHLQQNFQREVSIDEVAGRVSMSPRTFARRFKAATGKVPGEYLQSLRISAAKELLETDHAPIQKVSSRIGYEDVAFFRSVFKRHTGMTPAEYRSRFARMTFEPGELVGGAAG
jgi:transcriptional regulator GlxA family with amidase domain